MTDSRFPVVRGRYQLTRDWSVALPGAFHRRLEDDSLVPWRPGITVWTNVWNNDKLETMQQRLEWLHEGTSPEAFESQITVDGAVTRYAYRLTEQRDGGVVHALYAFAIGPYGHVQMAVYFDDEADLSIAREIAQSLDCSPAA
jgi:hypothetical protein